MSNMHGNMEDINNVFAEAVTLVLAVGAHDFGAEIDLRSQKLPANTPVWLVIKIETGIDSAGDGATVQFKHLTDSDSAYGSAVVVYDSGAVAEATLVVDYLIVSIPINPETIERYNKITATIAVENVTVGVGSAFLTTVKPFRNVP